MRDLLLLAIHLFVTVAKLLRPGGARAVAAESLLLKQQVLIRLRNRAIPNIRALFDQEINPKLGNICLRFDSKGVNPHFKVSEFVDAAFIADVIRSCMACDAQCEEHQFLNR